MFSHLISPVYTLSYNVCAERACDYELGSQCYNLVSEAASWTDAFAYCQARGGHLPDVTNDAERDFLFQIGQGNWFNYERTGASC